MRKFKSAKHPGPRASVGHDFARWPLGAADGKCGVDEKLDASAKTERPNGSSLATGDEWAPIAHWWPLH